MGIHQLLYSSFCFLNINTVITRQLIQKARMLEAEWWQDCGEEWVWGQRRWVKYWALLGCWISLCYSSFSFGARFETYAQFISVSSSFFFSDRGQPRLRWSTCTVMASLTILVWRVTTNVVLDSNAIFWESKALRWLCKMFEIFEHEYSIFTTNFVEKYSVFYDQFCRQILHLYDQFCRQILNLYEPIWTRILKLYDPFWARYLPCT